MRSTLGPVITACLMSAFVLKRLDYCKCSVCQSAGSNNRTATTCSECRSSTCQGSRSSGSRVIIYKLCVLMYQIHTGRSPSYMSSLVIATADISSRSGLRSASTNRYELHTTRLKFGERCFSHAGPKAWNMRTFRT